MNRHSTQFEKPATALSPAFEPALSRAANISETTIDEPQMARLPLSEDELVSSLSNAYENRRARQVFEWESTRRRAAESNARYISFA